EVGGPTLREVCAHLHEKINTFLTTSPRNEKLSCVQQQTRISLSVVHEALSRYSFDELALSFNGGKDCLVLLILFLSALHTHPHPPPAHAKIQSVYVQSSSPFPEVDSFVSTCVSTYQLSLHRYALGMKSAFEQYLRENPAVKAIFVGTRRTDPHGEFLTHFDMTDHGWPNFMRIQPVIDWHYREVWLFLRELNIPYCCLYDMGYTSLGGTTDTLPNPVLLVPGSKDQFYPAYDERVDDAQERLGRHR
ncbi:hypothetical protein FN846DRAFT_759569, partial [Sphaerosporella brunnea]